VANKVRSILWCALGSVIHVFPKLAFRIRFKGSIKCRIRFLGIRQSQQEACSLNSVFVAEEVCGVDRGESCSENGRNRENLVESRKKARCLILLFSNSAFTVPLMLRCSRLKRAADEGDTELVFRC